MKNISLYTGATMPPIGFGTWQILLNGKAKRTVASAIDAGYRLIDTAMVYGNEKGVGAAVRHADLPRKEIFLTTKLWNFDQGYDSAKRALKASLARLDLDYVDLYLIHWPKGKELTKESWKAMEEMVEAGLTKHIGVSNFGIEELKDLLEYARIKPAVNQIEFHPFIYENQKPVLDFCEEQGIVIEAYSPLARAGNMHHEMIKSIAEESAKSPAQVMLRWAIQHGTVPLPKTTHVERMKENLAVFDFSLSEEQMLRLDGLTTGQSVL